MNSRIVKFYRESGICIPISGNSMQPVLSSGDRISVVPRNPGIGDIALFRSRNAVVIHRVIWKRGPWIYTIGDNSPVPDPPVHEENIIGTVGSSPRKIVSVFSGLFRTSVYHLKNLVRAVLIP